MAYDENFKIKVVEYCKRGNTYEDAAGEFAVTKGAITGWVKRYDATGRIEKKIQDREHKRKVTPDGIDKFLVKNPHGDQQEMADSFGCSNQAVSVALKKFGFSKKKLKGYTKRLIL